MNKNNFFFTSNISNKLDTKYKKKVIEEIVIQKIEKNEFLNLSISEKKRYYLFLFFFICIFIILFRIIYLQLFEGNDYRKVAEGNSIKTISIPATRGLVYDRNMELLVKNLPMYILKITPVYLPAKKNDNDEERQKIFSLLEKITEIKSNEIIQKISNSDPWDEIIISDQLTYSQIIQIKLHKDDLPGIEYEIKAKREYQDDVPFSHLIGYTGKITEEEYENYSGYMFNDIIGKTGIELYYEKILKGKYGKKQIEVDSAGQEIKNLAEEKASNGKNIILTIDKELQDKSFEILDKVISSTEEAKGGVVVIMNPNNGEILTLASYPSFSANEFINGISSENYSNLLDDEGKPLLNKSISGEYPAGSTFKLVVASAALQEKVADINTIVESTGKVIVNNWEFPDYKKTGHGTTDIIKALAESVNTYFYIIGGGTFNPEKNIIEGGLGIDRINIYANKFGLGKKTNIDLPGEKTGFLPTKEWKKNVKQEDWYIGDTYHVSIGQGDILVTPLQVANYTSVIANGGYLYQPHIVKQINASNNQIDYETKPIILKSKFIDYSNIEIVQRGMREAVLNGSAKKMINLPIDVAAKTGTAQHSGEGKDHSWLTAYAPYNQPELVITVLIEQGGEGTQTALPVATEILNWYYNLN